MAQVLVRGLDQAAVDRMKERARRANRSLEAEIRQVIEDAARQDAAADEFWRLADQFYDKLRGRKHTDSAVLIREDREAWRSE